MEPNNELDFDALANWIIEKLKSPTHKNVGIYKTPSVLNTQRRKSKRSLLLKPNSVHLNSISSVRREFYLKNLRNKRRQPSIDEENPYKEPKYLSNQSVTQRNNGLSINHSRNRLESINSLVSSQKSRSTMRSSKRIKKNQNETSITNMRNIREKIKKLLPDPNHPWRDPLKNSPFKWYEMIDVSSDSDEESITENKCSFLKVLTVNRKKRREEAEIKMRALKMTPEYGINAAKIRLKKKKKREDVDFYTEEVDNLTSKLTSELSNSVAAYNLKILLKKKWYEDKKQYKIMNKLTKKQEERLSRVIPKHRFS
mmetsp:Transcript_19212/g.17030  ORF Transcript_19212/g.17030 Transcript_19212/m.17030 type:complete len:312 (+) Transcript_19212:262-1197(+)